MCEAAAADDLRTDWADPIRVACVLRDLIDPGVSDVAGSQLLLHVAVLGRWTALRIERVRCRMKMQNAAKKKNRNGQVGDRSADWLKQQSIDGRFMREMGWRDLWGFGDFLTRRILYESLYGQHVYLPPTIFHSFSKAKENADQLNASANMLVFCSLLVSRSK